MTLSDLETPALVLDRAKLVANCERMAARIAGFGVHLRPHLKTLKSADAAMIACHLGSRGITVATLKEADYFLDHGFVDLLHAVCVTPNKFAHALELIRAGVDLTLLTDSAEIAGQLARFADEAKTVVKVMVEVDSGEHRTGVAPDDGRLVEIAQILDRGAYTAFAGVLTHAGHSYQCRSPAELRGIAEEERRTITQAAETIRESGIECPAVSLGSTPTAMYAKSFEGVTEVRAGVYMAGDLFQANIGTCDMDDIALSVLSTVVSRDRQSGRVVIDAGGLALSKDRSTRATDRDLGYGVLADLYGRPFTPLEIIEGVHQEHGEISVGSAKTLEMLSVGDLVRVLPNHACMTAGPYDRYHVVEGGDEEVIAVWDKALGW